MTTNDVYVDAFKYTMCWVLGHFAISLPLKLVYGDKRSEAMVMGGAGNDTKGKDGTKLTHLLAYNGVTVVYQCFCAYYGTMGWYVTGDAASIGGSAQDRLYGTTSISQMLVVATASFELYNSVSVMLMPGMPCPPSALVSLHSFCASAPVRAISLYRCTQSVPQRLSVHSACLPVQNTATQRLLGITGLRCCWPL